MIYLILIWLFLGLCGYFMMRQGFLVRFEERLGKRVAWRLGSAIVGIMLIYSGVYFMLLALLVTGRNCFRRRPIKRQRLSGMRIVNCVIDCPDNVAIRID